MLIGKVVESVWATKKDEMLSGFKLLVVECRKNRIVAIDKIGAGIGDEVIVSTGSAARMTAGNAPVDAAIIGIIDWTEGENV